MTVSIRATANPATNTIALEIGDERAETKFDLNMHEVVHMFAMLTQALQDIPGDRTVQLSDQQPALRAQPSYQIASSPDGDLVLIFRASPLPPFEFVLEDDAVSELRSAFEHFLTIPRSMRYQRPQ